MQPGGTGEVRCYTAFELRNTTNEQLGDGMNKALRRAWILAVALFALSGLANAQTYPSRPVRIIVPAAPGGTVDLLARAVSSELGKGLGQTVIVENKPGASTNLGNDFVAKSAPDGHTLLMSGITLSTNPHLYTKLSYDPQKDFAPISLIATSGNVLVVNPALGVSSVRELIAMAKSKPGRMHYGTPAVGATGHLAGEMFNAMAGVKLTQVPYKGAAPALADLIAGQIEMTFDNIPAAIGHIKGGKLRALAVTSAKRSAILPEVPTIAEAGVPGYAIEAWFGLVAPAQTSRDILARLHAESVKALAQPEVRTRFAQMGFEPVGSTPAEFARLMQTDLDRFGKIIRDAGIKGE
jgi:tripartite-type tricarboxylate transporter receptor subunit TctC